MKRTILALASLFCAAGLAFAQNAQEITLKSSNGLLSAVCTKPAGFIEGQKCPVVVMLHNVGSTKEDSNLKEAASQLEQQGIGTLRFDFSGHGASGVKPDGSYSLNSRDLTLKTLCKDVATIIDYLKSQPYVKTIGLMGYGLGGVVAILSAEDMGKGAIGCLALMTPDLSLREDALRGNLYGKSFTPADPPRKLAADALAKDFVLGRDFIEEAQKTNILQKASGYKGATAVFMGSDDATVPYSYGEYLQLVMKDAKAETLKGIDHNFAAKDAAKHTEAIARVVKFMVKEMK